MSYRHRRVSISQPLVEKHQRPRASRHNKPHQRRITFTEVQQVPAGTPGAVRSVETDTSGDLVVVHKAHVVKTKWVPVTQPYTMRVAAGTTVGEKQKAKRKMVKRG